MVLALSGIATVAAAASPAPTPVPRSQADMVVIRGPEMATRAAATTATARVAPVRPQGHLGKVPELLVLRNRHLKGGSTASPDAPRSAQGGAK